MSEIELTEKEKENLSYYEKNILYFILKDVKYIDIIFQNQKVPIYYFTDKHVKRIVELAIEYYRCYESRLVEDEFTKGINELFSRGKIDRIEHITLSRIFSEVSGDDSLFRKIEDDQFNRIFDTWINLESVPLVKKILKKNITHLNDNRGLDVISSIQNDFDEVFKPNKERASIDTLSVVRDTDRQIEDAEKRRSKEEGFLGIKTGISSIDEYFNGFEKGTLSAVGGLPGHGKSTFLLNFSRNQFLDGKRILIISLEMPCIQWSRRLNCSYTRAKYKGILKGDELLVPEDDYQAYKDYIKKRSTSLPDNYNILFMPAESHTWPDITREIDKRFPYYNPDLLYIDQLSLISLSDIYKYEKKRDIALGELTRNIRSFAQVRNIPIVVALQANRASILRDPKGERKIDINIENIEDSNKIGANLDNFLAVMKLGSHDAAVKIVKQRDGDPDKTIMLSADWECGWVGSKIPSSEDFIEITSKTNDDILGELEEEDEDKNEKVDDELSLLLEEVIEEDKKETKEKNKEKDFDTVIEEEINKEIENLDIKTVRDIKKSDEIKNSINPHAWEMVKNKLQEKEKINFKNISGK
jgi:replicative DNA helicase